MKAFRLQELIDAAILTGECTTADCEGPVEFDLRQMLNGKNCHVTFGCGYVVVTPPQKQHISKSKD